MSLTEKTDFEDIEQQSPEKVAQEFRKLVFASQRDDAKALAYFNYLTPEQKHYIKFTKPYELAWRAINFHG